MTLCETMKEGYWEVVVDNLAKGKVNFKINHYYLFIELIFRGIASQKRNWWYPVKFFC